MIEAIAASALYVGGIFSYIRLMNRRSVAMMLTEIEQHLITEGFLHE